MVIRFSKISFYLFPYLSYFLYLCRAEEHHTFMSQNTRSFGRTELAQCYFPNIQPQSAWLKLKALLLEDPSLAHLTQLKRRTSLPCEVNKIYQALGQPWLPFFRAFQALWLSTAQTLGFKFWNTHFKLSKTSLSPTLPKAIFHNWTIVNNFIVICFSVSVVSVHF